MEETPCLSCGGPQTNRTCALILSAFAAAPRSWIGRMNVGGGVRAPRVLLDRCSRTSAGLAVKRLALCQRPLATLLLSLKTELLFLFFSLSSSSFPASPAQSRSVASAADPSRRQPAGLAPQRSPVRARGASARERAGTSSPRASFLLRESLPRRPFCGGGAGLAVPCRGGEGRPGRQALGERDGETPPFRTGPAAAAAFSVGRREREGRAQGMGGD